ncbi:MAG TPA: SOS response-associated peptidase [Candidatus Saccharimonadales bacterium]|nr:SOS response-associated peptidase [Candidatus Saccharimonadales bacterium]
MARYTFRMCGRFRIAQKKEILEAEFEAEVNDDLEWVPRYNAAPGQDVAVVRQDKERPIRKLSQMRWGLIPSWTNDPRIGFKTINARAETVATVAAFREPFRLRRCLIPADGFYEWKREGKAKLPFCFTLTDGGVFAFAGLWDRWKSPQGQWVTSCSILTTTANEVAKDVHDRMPVILPRDVYDVWLDPGFQNVQKLRALLNPYPAAAMRRYRVSQRVNKVENDDAECAEEIEAAQDRSVAPGLWDV